MDGGWRGEREGRGIGREGRRKRKWRLVTLLVLGRALAQCRREWRRPPASPGLQDSMGGWSWSRGSNPGAQKGGVGNGE
eukprot:1341966-Rhodomonas_salina.2